MSDVGVVLVEDDAGYREALELLFGATDGFRVAGSFGSATQMLETVANGAGNDWELALVDIQLPGIDGIEAAARLKRSRPGMSVVMLTVLDDPSAIVRAICAGVDGYLGKSASTADIITGVRAVLAGGSGLTPSVARKVMDLVRPPVGERRLAPVPGVHLSTRQLDVLRLLVEGRIYKEIAADLGISLDTVRSHIRQLYRRLQVHTVSEAVSKALRAGLV